MRKNLLLRLCSREDDGMSQAIADEARMIVREAAKPVTPGQSIAAQINTACRNLGYPAGSWRVTAAWYHQGGCWSAAAIVDLQSRFVIWREAQDRRSADALSTEQARQAATRRAALEQSRLDHLAALAAIESRLALLGGHNAD